MTRSNPRTRSGSLVRSTRWLAVLAATLVFSCSSDKSGTNENGMDGTGAAPAEGACQGGQQLCDGACVSVQTDSLHCGACSQRCISGASCVNSSCVCPTDRLACPLACVNAQQDVLNCGGCDHACSTGAECVGGTCQCQADMTSCSGSCVNLQSDRSNCGACGAACPAGQVCSAGGCAATCAVPGQVECDGSCVDPNTDAFHCGSCGHACGAGVQCVSGQCDCPTGQSLCGGQCVLTASDPDNCGTCGNPCAPGQTCDGGVCVGGSGTGGTSATGGAASTGGTDATGGVSATGAAANTGGSATTGGDGSTGGATQTGGETSSGGNSGVVQSVTCPDIAWPSSSGTQSFSGTQQVSGVYDGGMAVHEGPSSFPDCSSGDQEEGADPLFEVADGGTVRNVIMGKRVGDGIHCEGSCTIENVWFPNVCDDAISALGSGTVTISNCGFKNARDKTIQHNGSGTVNIDTVYVEVAGKLYRSCGEGCSGSSRTAHISNVVAIGVDQIAGVSTNDTVTLENICAYRSAAVCTTYEPGSDTKATNGVNGSNDGPSSNCVFSSSDIHALIDSTQGVAFATESLCGGPNGFKSGDTATACVSGYDQCLKMCAPGGYGLKELTCTDGLYDETTGCALPADPTAASMLAGSRVGTATNTVAKNENCSSEWDIGLDSSNTSKFCVCVKKPGYYSFDNWLAWDCQSKWW